ncbi:YdcH family protein [Frigidibacter sp. ROC022]|uniref:YdcH family protein n=1 Tax=Frigidibacter sp. ROC022 TaxID=2971796 RepID=UPI00215AD228|nr:DUF465 domain-containing protein [Frigidibacter sp. ROC022]MCR8725835.1 DUF465 domain-containing protein [Frigidibacter sp. ROC022]
MSNTPHELADDFPGKADAIHALRESDPHFRRLTDDYHTLNRTIHRAETRVDIIDEAEETRLRKERMVLKDQIAALLG